MESDRIIYLVSHEIGYNIFTQLVMKYQNFRLGTIFLLDNSSGIDNELETMTLNNT